MPRVSTIIFSVCPKHADFFQVLVLPKPYMFSFLLLLSFLPYLLLFHKYFY